MTSPVHDGDIPVMDIKKHIGKRIRQIRGQLKLTQLQLANALHVSPASVSAWELGDSGISIEAAIRLAKLAGVSLDYLLQGMGEARREWPEEPPARHEALTPDETRMLEAYRKAGRADQRALVRFAAAVARKSLVASGESL